MDVSKYRVAPGSEVRLSEWSTDDSDGVERDAADARRAENIETISMLQHRLYAEHKRSVLIVLQAMDAAGKDSTIRHVLGAVNPQGVQVKAFKRPTPDELEHDFLWRVHRHAPQRGHIQVFNRSHYEDVLIARVNGLVPEERWRARYEIINQFEALLAQAGTEIVKVYLHVSKDRQKEKLLRRLTDPSRNWKFEAADFETRAGWDEYMRAYEDAIGRCSTDDAPWYIVPTDRKWHRITIVSEIVRQTLENIGPKFPEPSIDPQSALKLLDQLT